MTSSDSAAPGALSGPAAPAESEVVVATPSAAAADPVSGNPATVDAMQPEHNPESAA